MSATIIGLPRKLRFIRFGASKAERPAVPQQVRRPTADLASYAEHRPPVVIPFRGRATVERHG